MRRPLCALVCGLALCLLAPVPGFADPPAALPSAAPGALAAQLIETAHAEGVFLIAPDEHRIAVRHAGSGLVCRMEAGWTNRILIFTQMARGEDVACDTSDGRETVTLYATRFPFDTDVNEQVRGAADAIHQRYPNARPYQATLADASNTQSAQFVLTRGDGVQMYSRVSVAMVRGWVIKMRYSVQANDQDALVQGEARAAAVWTAVLAELNVHQA